MLLCLVFRLLPLIFFLASAVATHGQISKGHRILIEHGLQVQGMVVTNAFNLSTYTNANYSAVHWQWYSEPSWMGLAPGVPWAKWAVDETNMPPQAGEAPYLDNLLMIQLGDEWDMDDNTLRTRMVNWINSIRTN